jgi:FHA domain
MSLSDLRLQVHPGRGIVGHFASAVVVCFAATPDQHAVADDLLARIESAAHESDAPGAAIARRCTEVSAAAPPEHLPALAVVSAYGDGLAVLLHGDIELELDGPGEPRLSGRDAVAWLDRVIGPGVTSIVIRPAGETDLPAAAAWSWLEAGVVPGSGATLVATGGATTEGAEPAAEAEEPEPEPAEPQPEPAPAEAEEPEPEPAEPEPEPEPQEPEPEPDEPEPEPRGAAPAAEGRRPDEPAGDGASEAPEPGAAMPLSEPIGALVGDDGSTLELDGNYVVGRKPLDHPDVVKGLAKPFAFPDTDPEISRAHTLVLVEGTKVSIADLGSANGTFIAKAGATEWQPLEAGVATPIAPGDRVLIGRRTFVFEPRQGATAGMTAVRL